MGLVQRYLRLEKAEIVFGDLRLGVVVAEGVLQYACRPLEVRQCKIKFALVFKNAPDVVDISSVVSNK